MGIVVQTNVPSLIAQNAMTTATTIMNQSMERMTTGYKINSAKDDAAGLYVATSLDKNIRGSEVAKQNVQMGTDMLSVAEGDLAAIEDNLMRIRDLTLTAANGIYDANSLGAIKAEVDTRLAEIDRVANVSEYNGKQLLSGDAFAVTLQIGANSSENDKITISNVFGAGTKDKLGIEATTEDTFKVGGTTTDFLEDVDDALKKVQDKRTQIGAYQNQLDSAASSLASTIENLSSSKSTIMDADIAAEASKYINGQILQQVAVSLLAQANSSPQVALSLI